MTDKVKEGLYVVLVTSCYRSQKYMCWPNGPLTLYNVAHMPTLLLYLSSSAQQCTCIDDTIVE